MTSKKKQGMILPFVLILSAVLAILLLYSGRILKISAIQNNYLVEMDRTRHLAETGLNDAMKKLAFDPDPANIPNDVVSVASENGKYSNVVALRTVPVDPTYYVITSATRNVQGHSYYCTLHSYVRVSNTSRYFTAVTDSLTLSHPVDISLGNVYGSTLTFLTDANTATLTKVHKAEYLNACFQSDGIAAPTVWDGTAKTEIKISLPTTGEPTKLPAPLIFPQLSDADLNRYQQYAGPHVATNSFKGQIYPPGYANFNSGSMDPGDFYVSPMCPGHTTDNRQHVYFYDGDIYIEGTIHGQILFVATGNIYITGDLMMAPDTNYPGFGSEMGSAAHQVVLMTRKNVYIDNTKTIVPPAYTTQIIQAMIIAPHGSLIPVTYNDDNKHRYLKLDFTGSLILSTLNTTPLIPEIFQGGRTYAYMDSLLQHSPPYLPVISQIFCSFETSGFQL